MYTTKSKIENYLQIEIDDSLDTSVDTWIGWIKRYIDNYTGTTFETGTVDDTKYYDILVNANYAFIDDCTTVTSASILDAEGNSIEDLSENDDYWLYPLNRSYKNELRLNPKGNIGAFPAGSRRLKVVGKFGVGSSVPEDIEMVATQMVADIISGMSDEAKNKKSETLGEYAVTFEQAGLNLPKYKEILDLYRTPTV